MGALTPETCRVTLQWNKSDCILLNLVGLLFNMNWKELDGRGSHNFTQFSRIFLKWFKNTMRKVRQFWGLHSGVIMASVLLGCDTMLGKMFSTFGVSIISFFSWVEPTKKDSIPDNGGSKFLRKFCHPSGNDATSYAQRPKSSKSGHTTSRSKSNPLFPQYSWKRYRWSSLILR